MSCPAYIVTLPSYGSSIILFCWPANMKVKYRSTGIPASTKKRTRWHSFTKSFLPWRNHRQGPFRSLSLDKLAWFQSLLSRHFTGNLSIKIETVWPSFVLKQMLQKFLHLKEYQSFRALTWSNTQRRWLLKYVWNPFFWTARRACPIAIAQDNKLSCCEDAFDSGKQSTGSQSQACQTHQIR